MFLLNFRFQVFFATLFFSSALYANDYSPGNVHFERCLQQAMKTKAGIVIKVEMKQEQNESLIYEFDIRDENNKDWDIECDANQAKIIEIEEEVFSPKNEKFSKNMKVDLARAKSIALKRHPGEIIEVEYEIESDGLAVYEFDINADSGEEIKIEINATSGEIHEENRELWQIGYE